MYEPFYRLTGKPFQLSPDPSFYYGSPVHRRAYAYLEYGMYQGEGFIVITGEVGAGKTTLVRNLLAHLDARQVVAAHLVSTQLDADDLLRAVANAFGLPAKNADKASLLAELEGFLRRLTDERKRALLIVDEAQNLTPRAVEELRMLSNFQAGERALLQSFLIGQPELRPILQGQDMQQFRQRTIASYHLGPLDSTETESYILHRLKQVGWIGDPRLERDAFEGIYAFTAGIPRRINMVCNRLLLAGFLNEKHALDGNDVELVAGEIKEELGLAPRTAAGAEVRSAADVQDLQSTWEGANGHPDTRSHRTASAASPGAESDRELTQRVARLERTLALIFGMLRRVVQVMEPLEKPFKELRH
jgi:putative secretion ATPase (PEP-CTERM system associated)